MNPQLQEVLNRIEWISRSIDNRDGKPEPEDLLSGIEAVDDLLALVKDLGDPDITARAQALAFRVRARAEFAYLSDLQAVIGAHHGWRTFEFGLTMTRTVPRASEMPMMEPVFHLFRQMTSHSGESAPGTPESFREWMARADRWETIAGNIRESVKRRWKECWTPDLDGFFESASLVDLNEMGERIETDLRKILEEHPELVPAGEA